MPAPRRHLLAALSALLATTLIARNREPGLHFRAMTLDGQLFNNQPVQGRVVLPQFWTTWCPYCRQEQSLVDQITHEFAHKGLMVLAVHVRESKK
ncbi:MAG TPA: TlpA disulfide reductase family protein [Terriglobales bacterium]|nr:TlpA disulfide reductase family protein [Terriglobales bacterium]